MSQPTNIIRRWPSALWTWSTLLIMFSLRIVCAGTEYSNHMWRKSNHTADLCFQAEKPLPQREFLSWNPYNNTNHNNSWNTEPYSLLPASSIRDHRLLLESRWKWMPPMPDFPAVPWDGRCLGFPQFGGTDWAGWEERRLHLWSPVKSTCSCRTVGLCSRCHYSTYCERVSICLVLVMGQNLMLFHWILFQHRKMLQRQHGPQI